MRRAIGLGVVLAGAVMAAPRPATAQMVTSGVKIGVDFSSLPQAGQVVDQITGRLSVETSSRVGIAGGGFVAFGLTDRVAFEPELLFSTKGVTLDLSSGGSVSTRVNYIEFPLLIRYSAPAGSNRAFALVGPSFGIKAATSAHLDTNTESRDVDIDNAVRSFDAGFTVAGGVERSRFSLELRFTQGLTDIAKDTFPHADSLHNRVLAILFGVTIK